MSKLSKLMGKPEEIELEGEKFVIHPLTMKEIDLFVNMSSPEKQAEAIKQIITLTLKKTVPDATDEELDNVNFKYLMELFEVISKVNGLEKYGESPAVKKELERLKELKSRK